MADPASVRAAAVIVAAGRGTRAGGERPKQWQPLAGRCVIDWTVEAFESHPAIARLIVVLHPDDIGLMPSRPGLTTVAGGATRALSVRAGLEALDGTGTTHVLIHDAARACVGARVISGVLAALSVADAAAPGLPVTDALWRAGGDGDDATVAGFLDRGGLFRAQTPQGFRLALILAAHRTADPDAADDVAVARAAGMDVRITAGDPENLKITAPEDFARAERILRTAMSDTRPDLRIGNGFDVHRFGKGDHVILCGVRIPYSRCLQGHSDADVGLHAVTDAIYGALAEGDIGRHFPPSDPTWKGADSRIFLEHAAGLAAGRGFRISNIDLTFLCERPKIGPHASAMILSLAAITGVDTGRISVKATTTERLGFTGREEGIAAMATVALVAP